MIKKFGCHVHMKSTLGMLSSTALLLFLTWMILVPADELVISSKDYEGLKIGDLIEIASTPTAP